MRAGGSHCPLCGLSALLEHTVVPSDVPDPRPDVHILECASCHLAWQWPLIRSKKDSEDWYVEAYREHAGGTYFDPHRRDQVANLELDFIDGLMPQTGTLLDVGAGDGTFIDNAARRGWDASGVEPAPGTKPGVTFNTPGRPRLIRGTIDAVRPPQTFDVVTLWDVIEHVEDPAELLVRVRERLRPEGFVVIETGNYLSAGRIEIGAQWWCHQVDHRWYFAPDTCMQLLKQVGFGEFVHATRVFRPGSADVGPYRGPSRRNYLRRAFRHPFQAAQLWASMQQLRWLAQAHPAWASLEIFTLAAKPVRS